MKTKITALMMALIASPALLLADEFGPDRWYHHMGNGWGGHMGFMGGGWLMMILWVGLLVFAGIGLIRWAFGGKGKATVSANAISILTERFAKGELSKEQFEEMKKTLK